MVECKVEVEVKVKVEVEVECKESSRVAIPIQMIQIRDVGTY